MQKEQLVKEQETEMEFRKLQIEQLQEYYAEQEKQLEKRNATIKKLNKEIDRLKHESAQAEQINELKTSTNSDNEVHELHLTELKHFYKAQLHNFGERIKDLESNNLLLQKQLNQDWEQLDTNPKLKLRVQEFVALNGQLQLEIVRYKEKTLESVETIASLKAWNLKHQEALQQAKEELLIARL